MGLSNRYGRRMQAISGIHYNWSLPGLGNAEYFALIRNFRRHGWLLLYLFGASPAVCSSFVAGRARTACRSCAPARSTCRTPRRCAWDAWATRARRRSRIPASCNDLRVLRRGARGRDDAHLARLREDRHRSGPRTANYLQLSTALLQIENEFYGKIRPKCVMRSGERPLHALRERGVEYVEVRLMDLDPFAPVGITPPVCRFLDVFLLHCLRLESPPDTPAEIAAIGRNQEKVAARGREPGLTLDARLAAGGARGMGRAAASPNARRSPPQLDAALGGRRLPRGACRRPRHMLADPALTPSARVLSDLRTHGNSYRDFARAWSTRHRESLRAMPLPAQAASRFEQLAAESIEEQRAIEAADTLPFEQYRQRYLAPERLSI